MFGLFKKHAAVDALADELVTLLSTRFPIESERALGTNRLKPARSLGKAVAELDQRLTEFTRDQKPGVYGKARLLNRVKWQLAERGYSEDFVAATITELTVLVSRRAKAEDK